MESCTWLKTILLLDIVQGFMALNCAIVLQVGLTGLNFYIIYTTVYITRIQWAHIGTLKIFIRACLSQGLTWKLSELICEMCSIKNL